MSEPDARTDALRKSEELYRFLSEGMPQFVWVLDENGAVEYCNQHWTTYSGLSFERTAERGWLAMIHPEDVGEVVRRIRHSRQTGEDFEMEYRLLRASDRQWRWHIARVRLLEDLSGRRRWLGTAIDIDDIRRTEKALRASQQRFRRLMDAGIIGVAFWDKEHCIAEANDEFVRITGRARECFEGPSRVRVEDLIAPESTDQLQSEFARLGERGALEAREYRILQPGGTGTPVLAGFASLDEGGGMVLALDISDQKKLEEKLSQTAKLESLGILAGGVAHDFNNLLTGILGNASLALEEAPAGSNVSELLGNIVDASERAATLTHQMLAYSGRGRFWMEYVELSGLIESTLDLIESALGKTIVLNLELAHNLASVEGDPSQLRQLVMNLSINAAEAIEGAGTVTIRTGMVELDGSQHPDDVLAVGAEPVGRHVFLEVSDTGLGMDPPTLQRIFDPFFTTKFTGRGLGLAAALGIVRGHKGAIRVASSPGCGTTFTVYFPASAKPATYPEFSAAKASTEAHTPAGIILIVDDEEFVRETGRRALESAGYTVVCASDESETIEIFKTLGSQVALAIVDMTMPGATGEDVARRLRQMNPKLKVIATSGYPESEVRARFGGRMDHFLAKPYRSERLRELIRATLGS
jgi:two-component system cell cycle sensor histidine kinase/response regulator CckA